MHLLVQLQFLPIHLYARLKWKGKFLVLLVSGSWWVLEKGIEPQRKKKKKRKPTYYMDSLSTDARIQGLVAEEKKRGRRPKLSFEKDRVNLCLPVSKYCFATKLEKMVVQKL